MAGIVFHLTVLKIMLVWIVNSFSLGVETGARTPVVLWIIIEP